MTRLFPTISICLKSGQWSNAELRFQQVQKQVAITETDTRSCTSINNDSGAAEQLVHYTS